MKKHVLVGTLTMAVALGVAGCSPKTEPLTPPPAPENIVIPAPDAAADPNTTEDVTPPMEGAPEVGAPTADPAVPLSGDPVSPLPGSGDPAADLGTDNSAAAPADGAASANHQKLIGTSWQVDDITATFQDATKVQLAGPAFGETGTAADYTIDEQGNVGVNVGGMTHQGTWDGEKLTMLGKEATKK